MTTSVLPVRTPTGVRMIGCFYENGLNIQEIQAWTQEIAKAAGIEALTLICSTSQEQLTSVIVQEKIAGSTLYQPIVKTLVGRDYCIYMLILTARDDNYHAPLTEVAQELDRINLEPLLTNLPRQFELQVYTCREGMDLPLAEIPLTLFNRGRPDVLSQLQGLSIPLICVCWSDLNRYALIPFPPTETTIPVTNSDRDHMISQILDDLAHLVMYHHKLCFIYQRYQDHYQAIEALEIGVHGEIGQVRHKLPETGIIKLRQTLDQVSERFVELSQLAYAIQHSDYAANANYINLEHQLQNWAEMPIAGYPTLTHLLLPEARQIATSLSLFTKRIEGIRMELDSLIQVIRTRIDLGQQQKLIDMQHTMDVLEFLVLAGILLPFLQEMTPFLEQLWNTNTPAWLPRHGTWLTILAALTLAFLLILLLVPLFDWLHERRTNLVHWFQNRKSGRV